MPEQWYGGGEGSRPDFATGEGLLKLKYIVILLIILIGVGSFYYYSNRPKPVPVPEPKYFVWDIDMDQINHIEITLPQQNKSQSFAKAPDRSWHFDDAQQSPVDDNRWGAGITLLLSGPGAKRVIAPDATPEQLASFGFVQPQMKIALVMDDASTMDITIGDKTPDADAFYILAPGSNDVATVDISWHQVLERIVLDPPYVPASAKS